MKPSEADGRRRRGLGLIGCAGLAALGWPVLSGAQSPGGHHQTLPPAQSLRDELAAALTRKSPLVVMVSLEGCPHCRVARQSHLVPMWRDGLPIVQVDFRDPRLLTDFGGQTRSHDEMTRLWRVTMAPTLLFFGPGGREVAERMEGAYLPDFYRAYLEQRLDQARAKL
jgi:hypothetical protein